MIEAIPQDVALRLQLAMIAGREPATSYFELRAKRTTGAGMHQDFIPIRELERAARAITNRGQLTDTYIGAAPRAKRKGTADAIERVWCLWADCDTEVSIDRLRHFHSGPNLIVRSGREHGTHAWWQLSAPIPARHAQRCLRRLRQALASDDVCDPPRLMRPIGTFNHKYGKPLPVQCVHVDLGAHTLGDVVGQLPDDPRYLERPKPKRTVAATAGRKLDGLVRTILEAPNGNRNNALHWAACRAAEHDLDIEPIREAALAIGLEPADIESTIRSGLKQAA